MRLFPALRPGLGRISKDQRGGAGHPQHQPEATPAPVEETEPQIVCRACGFAITRPQEAIAVAGAHRHTFANPHGIVFEIACFHTAPGCAHTGAATDDFTWFAGHQWRLAVCGGCHEHLGWRYETGGADRFHGLIVDRLFFPP